VRPDLSCVDVRGNVDTRLAKLARGDFDALVLAVAGIERLGLTEAPYTAIPVATCVPAPGQGALAVETREEDSETRRLVGVLNDPASASCVRRSAVSSPRSERDAWRRRRRWRRSQPELSRSKGWWGSPTGRACGAQR
jgi:porphobilinogen deaminase